MPTSMKTQNRKICDIKKKVQIVHEGRDYYCVKIRESTTLMNFSQASHDPSRTQISRRK